MAEKEGLKEIDTAIMFFMSSLYLFKGFSVQQEHLTLYPRDKLTNSSLIFWLRHLKTLNGLDYYLKFDGEKYMLFCATEPDFFVTFWKKVRRENTGELKYS